MRSATMLTMMAFGARAFAPAVQRGAATPRVLSSLAASVEDTVAGSDVVVFSKSWCPCAPRRPVLRDAAS